MEVGDGRGDWRKGEGGEMEGRNAEVERGKWCLIEGERRENKSERGKEGRIGM